MSERAHYDWVVIGAGPAGQKAALHGAKEGRRVLVVDQARAPGGECVNRGTIPSKTLRETAQHFAALERRSAGVLRCELSPDVQLTGLMARLDEVRDAHARTMTSQLGREGVEFIQARARFVGERALELRLPGRGKLDVTADTVFIATGSRPRTPDDVPVDHEHVLDSDSILSLVYLPRSLIVLGAGVIAVEFASIFAALGVAVTVVDRYPLPVGVLSDVGGNDLDLPPGMTPCKFGLGSLMSTMLSASSSSASSFRRSSASFRSRRARAAGVSAANSRCCFRISSRLVRSCLSSSAGGPGRPSTATSRR